MSHLFYYTTGKEERKAEAAIREKAEIEKKKAEKQAKLEKERAEIAAEMNMSERNAQIIHGQALQSVNRILREELLRDIS